MENLHRNWINKYLMPDEYVVWNGRPGKGHLFTTFDIFMVPFSLIWCGFAIKWCVDVFLTGTPFFLFGIPFVGVGLYMVFGRFIHEWLIRKKTVYVITNKRIFSFSKNQIQTLDYRAQLTRKITRHQDGSGSIHFYSPDPSKMQGRYSTEQFSRIITFELANIPDVDRVLQILLN